MYNAKKKHNTNGTVMMGYEERNGVEGEEEWEVQKGNLEGVVHVREAMMTEKINAHDVGEKPP